MNEVALSPEGAAGGGNRGRSPQARAAGGEIPSGERQNLQIRRQRRKSLAMKVTPAGIVVLIPHHLTPDSPQVRTFIREGLQKLPAPQSLVAADRLTRDEILTLVEAWASRLEVRVNRTQLRAMRNKWGSVSTAGTLTLADDLLCLPRCLAEYVIVHELLHLRLPTHNRLYRLLLSHHVPDWRDREQGLAQWALASRQA